MTLQDAHVNGYGLGGSALAFAGGLFAKLFAQADQPNVASSGVILAYAGLLTAAGTLVVPIFKMVLDSRRSETRREIADMKLMLQAAEVKAQTASDKADAAVREAEIKAQQAINAARGAAKEAAATRKENRLLTDELMGVLRHSHIDTRKEFTEEIKKASVKPRILIVDDDTSFCILFSKWLTKHDFDVEYAVSIADALPKLNSKFTWVLLDWRLPDGSGLELLNHIKQQALIAKVMIVTGDPSEVVVDAAYRGMAERVWAKPITRQVMTELLDYLKRNQDAVPRPHMSDIDLPMAADPSSASGSMIVSLL
jgi:CheY-like chemotaxis protein